jgi:hypothetical protein
MLAVAQAVVLERDADVIGEQVQRRLAGKRGGWSHPAARR